MSNSRVELIEIRVAFADTDAMGIVHHANYLKYFEVARVGWLRNKGLDYRKWQDKGQHLPLVESHCRYKRPARFEDLLTIKVKGRRDGLRVIFEYEVLNKENGILLTTGKTEHVCVTAGTANANTANANTANAGAARTATDYKIMEPTSDLLDALN